MRRNGYFRNISEDTRPFLPAVSDHFVAEDPRVDARSEHVCLERLSLGKLSQNFLS